MQTIPLPTITDTPSTEQSPILFKPYNHFSSAPISLEIKEDQPRISAFKPVAKRIEPPNECEPNYYSPQTHALNLSSDRQPFVPMPFDSFYYGNSQTIPALDQMQNASNQHPLYRDSRKPDESLLSVPQNEYTPEQTVEKAIVHQNHPNYGK